MTSGEAGLEGGETKVDGSPLRSSLDDSSEMVKVKTQLEKLKEELLRQVTASEETLKEQKFQWTEQMKQLEAHHKSEMHTSREGAPLLPFGSRDETLTRCFLELTRHFQSMLDSKDQELTTVRERVEAGGNGGSEEVDAELQEKRTELAQLTRQMKELQQKEINSAFGIAQDEGDSPELQQLQQDYEELMIKYHELESRCNEMVTSEQLSERDTFWKNEIRHLKEAHAIALGTLRQQQEQAEQTHATEEEMEKMKSQWHQERSDKEALSKQKHQLEQDVARLKKALEERDSVWQQELVSGQREQQRLRKECASLKVR